tara:strand:- start:248 stop:571 length:324 start_codon:yes stop_codon:yes gene_type:complete
MSNVIQFPDRRRKQVEVEKELSTMQNTLQELYDAMRKVELGQQMLQEQTMSVEDCYQELMKLYASIIGSENITAEWLEYCTYVGIEKDPTTGKITISFEPPEMPEGA